MYPPIPCGTKPPECSRTCTRDHGCHHPGKVIHSVNSLFKCSLLKSVS